MDLSRCQIANVHSGTYMIDEFHFVEHMRCTHLDPCSPNFHNDCRDIALHLY